MTRKTTEAYKAALRYIEINIFKLKPSRLRTDFEEGLRKALNELYPGVVLNGCWYHYVAALRRKALSLGMFELITNDLNARTIFRMLRCLPLLPPEKIVEGFLIIRNEAHAFNLGREFKPFFDYFQYWINVVSCYRKKISVDLFKSIESIHPFKAIQ